MMTGLATIRLDGFVSLGVRRGTASGTFETIPIEGNSGVTLEANADGLTGGKGRITVEVIRHGKVLARSQPLTADGVHLALVWEDGAPAAKAVGSAPVRLRVRLEGTSRLYSFTFR